MDSFKTLRKLAFKGRKQNKQNKWLTQIVTKLFPYKLHENYVIAIEREAG